MMNTWKITCLFLIFLSIAPNAHAQDSLHSRHDGRRSYIGLGVKALFNDQASTVIDARATVGQYFSLRPDLIFNRKYTTPQIALTVDGKLTRWWWIYAGGGGAYNNDGDQKIQPYITTGIDLNLPFRLTLRFSGQVLFRPSDTDTGGMVTLNFRL